MAYTSAELITFFTNANSGKAPTAAQQLLLQSYATQTQTGALSDDAALGRIIDLLDGTTSVAVQSYQFFTGSTPSAAGIDYLVDSAANANDLNDATGQYAVLNTENRYINFAINLGASADGAGRAQFAATYGTLSFRDVVAVAYETIIGSTAAAAAGIDVQAAINYLARPENEAYLRAFVAERAPGVDVELAIRAAVVGQIMSAGATSDVGNYNAATERLLTDMMDGAFAGGITNDAGVNLLTAYPNAPTAGKTFTLTGGADTAPTFQGTIGADTFVATEATLSSGDILNGGAGIDTLIYASSGAGAVVEAGFESAGIEIVRVTSDAAGGTTFDVSNANGVTQLSNDNSSSNLTLTGLNAVTDLVVKNTSQAAGTVNTTVNYNAAAVQGASTVQNLTLENVFDPAQLPGAASKSTVTVNGVETFNVVGAGSARSNLVALASDSLQTVNISGDQGVTIGGLTFVGATGTVNAAANKGGVNVTLANSGAVDVTVTGGAGADRANFSAGFQAKDSFNGGDGVDTLALNNATATGVVGGTATNVEILEITDAAAGALDMSKYAGINQLDLAVGQGAALTVSKTSANVTINNVGLVAGSALTVTAATDSAADTVNLNYKGVAAGESTGILSLADAETINLSVTDDPTDLVVGTLTVAGITATDATKVVLTGNANLTINAITGPAAAAKALTSLDASGLSGKATIAGVDFATAGATVTAGAGGLALTGTGQGKDTVVLGAGADTIVYTSVTQSDDDMDTINNFDVTKDALDITSAGLVTGAAAITTSQQWLGSRSSFALAQGALTGGGVASAVYQEDEDILWIDSNGDGNLDNRDFRVKLTGVDGTKLTLANLKVATAGNTLTIAAGADVSTVASVGTTPANTTTTAQNDTVNATAAALVGSKVDAAGGTDTLNITGGGNAVMGADFTNFEAVTLAAATTFTANNTAKLSITGSTGADVITTGAATQSVNAGAGNDTVNFGGAATKDTALNGGDGTDILNLTAGADVSAATVAGFETLSLNGAATMKAAQYNAFINVTAAGGADSITFTDAFTGTVAGAVETVVLGDVTGNSVTLGAAGQNVTGGTKDDTLFVNNTGAAGTIDLGGGTKDTIVLTNGGSLAGATVSNVETINLTGGATLSVAQAGIDIVAGGNADAITFAAGDYVTVVTDADVEAYTFGDDTSNAFAVTVSGAAQNVTATAATDAVTFNVSGTYTGTLTGDVTVADTVNLANGANISGATLTGITNATINTAATLTNAQLGALTLAAVGANDTVTVSNAATIAEAPVNVENWVLASAAADSIELNLADAGQQAYNVNVAAGGADTVRIDNASINAGQNYVSVAGFSVADDEVRLEVGNAAGFTGGYQTISAANTNVNAPNTIVEINAGVGEYVDPTNSAAALALIDAATGTVADGNYAFVIYSGGNAAIYNVTVAGGDAFAGADDTIELVGVLNGVGNDALTVGNFA